MREGSRSLILERIRPARAAGSARVALMFLLCSQFSALSSRDFSRRRHGEGARPTPSSRRPQRPGLDRVAALAMTPDDRSQR